MLDTLTISVDGQGLHDVTSSVAQSLEQMLVEESQASGLMTLFIQHTSASLLVQENYDPSARIDLAAWLNRLVPEQDPIYTHTIEGPDDMPAHIKSALTATSLSIPVIDSRMALGTWQGIFLWEHRHHRGTRNIIIHFTH